MDKNIVAKILQETEDGYDLMSGKFSETRKFFWRGLEFIGNYAKNEDKVLDFGCGNGRLLELFSDNNIDYTGVDISQKLIDIAGSKYSSESIKFQKIDISGNLPLGNNYFSAIYSIAVFHHIPSEELRIKTIEELYRILKPEGKIIITVWNLWPASTRGESTRGGQSKYLKNILKNWASKLTGKSRLDWNDCYISFKNNEGKIFQRYHHAYTKKELCGLFERAGFLVEKCEIINGRNIILIGKK